MRAVVRNGELRGPLWPGWRGFQRFSRVRSPLKGTAFRLAWRVGYSHPGWSATSRRYSHSPFGCTAFRQGFSSARGGAHRLNAQRLESPVEAYIHIEIARFEWMRPMLTVRIHRHSSELTRRMSTSRLHREASGKRACDGLVRAAAGLAAVFCRGGRRRSPLKCTVPRVVWSAGYPHRSFRREWRRPFGCGQPAHPRTRITVHFDGERRGRRADDMPAVTLIQCLKRLRAGTSSAPQSLPPAFLMSLTDVARGRRSVRDRTTTWATNGTGSKGLTARTPIHSRYAAAMRIAGWPAERRRVRDRGDRIRSESLDGAR